MRRDGQVRVVVFGHGVAEHAAAEGIWGYAPLIVSLANTREVRYLVNRPGNAPSHQDAAEWIADIRYGPP